MCYWDRTNAGTFYLLCLCFHPHQLQGPLETLGWGAKSKSKHHNLDIHEEDPEAVMQAHINALTGALLAIGIKYAGTAHLGAQRILTEHVKTFTKAKIKAPDPHSGTLASTGACHLFEMECHASDWQSVCFFCRSSWWCVLCAS